MSNYNVDFQSGGDETSPTIDGKTTIVLPSSTTDTTSTSLTLTGRGVPSYGEIQQENFIRLLENFASKTAPEHPTIGQIWFDSVSNSAKVYGMDETWDPVGFGLFIDSSVPSDATEGTLWYNSSDKILYMKIDTSTVNANYPLYYTDWVQVWPHVVPYASITEYNVIAARLNTVIGTPSTSGSDSDVANNQYGWGQSDTVEIFTTMNAPSAFNNTKWMILISRLRKALRHTTVDETTVPTTGYIEDGRGPITAATTYTPAVTWRSGWQGNGIAGLATNYAALQTAITALETSRFTVNASGAQIVNSHTDTTLGSTWKSTRVLDVAFQFTSHAAAKAFFNTGSMARFTISTTNGASLAGGWYTTIHGAALDSSGFVIDYKGCKIGLAGSYISGSASVGFYDLTTSFQTMYTLARSGAYGTGSLVIQGKYDLSTGILTVRLSFNEDFDSGESANQLTVATDVRTPLTILSSAPHVDTPAIVAPTVTTSGTFLTASAGT